MLPYYLSARSQGSLNYILFTVLGAARIPALRAALGDPILARAHELGSTARQDSLVWTNICSESDLQRHYHTSLSQPLSVGALLAAHGFTPSKSAPPRHHDSVFPRFASTVDYHPYRLHQTSPGRGMLRHRGVWAAPSPSIRVVAMGYPLDVTCSSTLSNVVRSALLGQAVDSNICEWLVDAVSSPALADSGLISSFSFCDVWVFNTGASTHMTAHFTDFADFRSIPRR
jgi:hypothetical protein